MWTGAPLGRAGDRHGTNHTLRGVHRVGACLLAWCAVALMSGGCLAIPTGDDAGEAQDISTALRERYRFPVMSKIDPTRPAAGAGAGVKMTYVTVIGVVDRVDQDAVLAIVHDIRAVIATKPILVEFYREEVLTQTSAGGWHRDEVDLLRRVRVE